jgi:hypothetical protein
MVNNHYAVALLLAIAALETVHGAFVREVLGNRLPYDDKKKNEIINNFMREQGFYALVKISPYLFLEEQDKPSSEDLERCTKGIKIRNTIMHGITKKGKYKMQTYPINDYNNAYRGVLAVYKCFSGALEKRRAAKQKET